MADIELVIKIPGKDLEIVGNEIFTVDEMFESTQGRADVFQKTYCKENCGDRPCVDAMDRCIFIGELLLAPTIIEADKESEGKE